MTLKLEDFENVVGNVTTSNTVYDVVIKGATSTFAADTSWKRTGAKSARVLVTTASEACYGVVSGYSVTVAALEVSLRLNALPNIAAGQTCKLLSARAGSVNCGSIRYENGNVFKVVNAAGVALHATPPFQAGAVYDLDLVVTIGTTTSNGRIQARIWEDSALWDVFDSDPTNTGTAPIDNFRSGKLDGQGVFDGNIDRAALNDGSSTFIGPPAFVTAVASAGPDQTIDPYTGWVPGDGAAGRASLEGNESIGTDYTWSGPPGVSFVDTHDPLTQAILPLGLDDVTYPLKLTVTDGTATASDTAVVVAKGADIAYARGGVLNPSRFAYPA